MKSMNEPQSPIELAIFQSSIHSIAEEMGAALRRTSISPNIKERRDYSCALFDGREKVIAMGDHMPVHLGAMPMSVKAVVDSMKLEEGDIAILNDPYAGGTHLPDTRVSQSFSLPATGVKSSRPRLSPRLTMSESCRLTASGAGGVVGAVVGLVSKPMPARATCVSRIAPRKAFPVSAAVPGKAVVVSMPACRGGNSDSAFWYSVV